MKAGTSRTLFRSYSDDAFLATPTWAKLEQILTGNGGAYGLYGPRGSGKSWLMLRAIEQAQRDKGMGLWFPCPADYDTAAFLSALSDNLASAVERRYVRDNAWWSALRGLQFGLAIVVAVPVITGIAFYAAHGLSGKLTTVSVFSTLPVQLWQAAGAALGAFCVLAVVQIIWINRSGGRLAREATALRERIRYTTALRLGTEVDITGGGRLASSLKRTRQKDLNERPATVASLVFDFRGLAAAITTTTKRRLVIGIDELDKIEDPERARQLLRDIKGIFEITGVFFLVSVSEEAATALHLGTLQGKNRNEFNSSFYTVLELPPLDPAEITSVLTRRGWNGRRDGAMLCLLSCGNWREAVRLGESWRANGTEPDPSPGELARRVLAEEARILRREIERTSDAADTSPLAREQRDTVLAAAWRAFPDTDFESGGAFDTLSKTAIPRYWNLLNPNATWQNAPSEPWRGFLIRLFIIGRLASGESNAFSSDMITDLRDVLITANRNASVARLMLEDRFGADLASPYTPPPGMARLPVLPSLS